MSDAAKAARGSGKLPPRVSIGVPVYNGAKFLRQTLDSILVQTFTDFEVILCDNGSTDDTPLICDEYARRDSRVRLWRSPSNLGPSANYNKCFELSRGELFKWNAADDLIAPDFVEKCVRVLDANPDVVSVYPRSKRINEKGEVFGEYPTELDLSSRNAAVRLWKYVFANHRKHHAAELWGVMRADKIRQWSPLKGSFPSADRVTVGRVILAGPLKRVEEYLFFDRTHAGRSELSVDKSVIRQGSKLAKYIGCGPMPPYQWWDASKAGKIVFPEWRWLWEYWRGVFLVRIPAVQRLL